MEQRLIDANKIRYTNTGYTEKWRVDMQPTIDATPVVRCGECKYCIDTDPSGESYGRCTRLEKLCGNQFVTELDDFCSYGERKDAEGVRMNDKLLKALSDWPGGVQLNPYSPMFTNEAAELQAYRSIGTVEQFKELAKAKEANVPLTLGQLHQMDGEWVWVEDDATSEPYYGRVNVPEEAVFGGYNGEVKGCPFDMIGPTKDGHYGWVAYRRRL